jgi:hypothetical protein
MALLVLVGSVPTVVIGLLLRPVFEDLNAPLPVALALIATGVVLWTAPRGGPKATVRDLTFRDASSPASPRGWRSSRASPAPAPRSPRCCGAAPPPTSRRACRS